MVKKIALTTLRNVTLATLYIFAVSQIMQNGENLFSNNEIFVPFIILLLFSLSAAVVGGLVFGSSLFLFFDGKKKESILSVFYSIGWLGFYFLLSLTILFIIK